MSNFLEKLKVELTAYDPEPCEERTGGYQLFIIFTKVAYVPCGAEVMEKYKEIEGALPQSWRSKSVAITRATSGYNYRGGEYDEGDALCVNSDNKDDLRAALTTLQKEGHKFEQPLPVLHGQILALQRESVRASL